MGSQRTEIFASGDAFKLGRQVDIQRHPTHLHCTKTVNNEPFQQNKVQHRGVTKNQHVGVSVLILLDSLKSSYSYLMCSTSQTSDRMML